MTVSIQSPASKTKRTRAHRPLPPVPAIDLSKDGRLRVSDVAALLRIGVSTLWARVASGKYPAPQRDGRTPWWPTSDIRPLVEKQSEQ